MDPFGLATGGERAGTSRARGQAKQRRHDDYRQDTRGCLAEPLHDDGSITVPCTRAAIVAGDTGHVLSPVLGSWAG